MRIPPQFEVALRAHKGHGRLQEVQPKNLPVQLTQIADLSAINLFVFSCGDGHQFMDITAHTFDCWRKAKRHYGLREIADDCFHWFAQNGGPFILSVPALQTGTLKRAATRRGKTVSVLDNMLFQIEGAMSLKKLNVGLLHPHALCGMVKDIFHELEQYEDALARAKELLMAEYGFGKEHVLCWLQAHCVHGRRSHHLDYSVVAGTKAA